MCSIEICKVCINDDNIGFGCDSEIVKVIINWIDDGCDYDEEGGWKEIFGGWDWGIWLIWEIKVVLIDVYGVIYIV